MSANAKGEVPFEFNGRAYTLLLDFNALCDLEADIPDIMEGGADVRRPSIVRLLFWAALKAKHGTEEISKTTAGEMIQELGIGRARLMLDESLNTGFGRAADEVEGDAPADPPPAPVDPTRRRRANGGIGTDPSPAG